jgi:hypothetical protein
MGIQRHMADTEEFGVEVPVADAVEQQRPTNEPKPDEEEAITEPEGEVPLEATPSDWQEQREAVLIDPELDEFDRG